MLIISIYLHAVLLMYLFFVGIFVPIFFYVSVVLLSLDVTAVMSILPCVQILTGLLARSYWHSDVN